jgi:DNA-binding LacI/PurR family transcriptional regulator
MVKLKDVAALADVSIGTVSNVVNGRTQTMGADILARVQHAIATLGYQPNRAAQFLKTGHTPLIGLLVPSTASPIWGWLSREVEIAAQTQYGYRILAGNTDRDPEKEMAFLDDLLSHGIRGVIIVSPLLNLANLDRFIRRGLVAVVHDQRSLRPKGCRVDFVSISHVEAMTIAVEHLIANGHRRLAFVTASGRSVSRGDKIDGFFAATKKARLSATSEVIEGKSSIRYGDDEMPQLGRTIAEEIVARPAAERPTGIVALNDLMAIGLIFGFQTRGLRVPEDISVIGMDDLLTSAFISPGITTVRPPLAEMAQKMVSRIVGRLGESGDKPEQFIFSPQLVVRGSVANVSPGLARNARIHSAKPAVQRAPV